MGLFDLFRSGSQDDESLPEPPEFTQNELEQLAQGLHHILEEHHAQTRSHFKSIDAIISQYKGPGTCPHIDSYGPLYKNGKVSGITLSYDSDNGEMPASLVEEIKQKLAPLEIRLTPYSSQDLNHNELSVPWEDEETEEGYTIEVATGVGVTSNFEIRIKEVWQVEDLLRESGQFKEELQKFIDKHLRSPACSFFSWGFSVFTMENGTEKKEHLGAGQVKSADDPLIPGFMRETSICAINTSVERTIDALKRKIEVGNTPVSMTLQFSVSADSINRPLREGLR